MLTTPSRAKYFSRISAVEFPDESRSHIALTFKIDGASDSLVICDTARVALTRPTKLTSVQEQQEERDGFFSLETPIIVSAPAGDTDGINLPWFDTADSILMSHYIQRDRAFVKLRVGFRQGARKLEVWPGEDHWVCRSFVCYPSTSIFLFNSGYSSFLLRIRRMALPFSH
jgi:hypothetical protein